MKKLYRKLRERFSLGWTIIIIATVVLAIKVIQIVATIGIWKYFALLLSPEQ